MMSAAIAGGLIAADVVRLVTTGRLPAGELRHTAFAAATLLTALGLSSRHTLRTLELARQIEYARMSGARLDGSPPSVRRTDAQP